MDLRQLTKQQLVTYDLLSIGNIIHYYYDYHVFNVKKIATFGWILAVSFTK